MFCDSCGASLQPEQGFCSACGKEVRAGANAYLKPRRVQQHVRLLGILWLAMAALSALGGVVLMILSRTLFPHIVAHSGAPAFLTPMMGALSMLLLFKGAFGFAAGYGLLQREPWARVLSLVLAFLSLFNAPFGTALGIYTLWVLLPAESERDYQEQARSVHAP
jgi:hypothetical protein